MMSDAQLYLVIGVPIIVNAALITVLMLSFRRFKKKEDQK